MEPGLQAQAHNPANRALAIPPDHGRIDDDAAPGTAHASQACPSAAAISLTT